MSIRSLTILLTQTYRYNTGGQPYISRGRYSSFKEVIAPIATNFKDRISTFNDNQVSFQNNTYAFDTNLDGVTDFSFDNPDFSFIQFRSNLVARWEYIPGSEVFLVWSQDISQSGDPNNGLYSSLESGIFGNEKPKNIFLIKATYRFIL